MEGREEGRRGGRGGGRGGETEGRVKKRERSDNVSEIIKYSTLYEISVQMFPEWHTEKHSFYQTGLQYSKS